MSNTLDSPEALFARTVSDDEIEAALNAYRRDGYARIPAVVSPAFVQKLRTRHEDIVRGRVGYPGLFFQPDAPSGRYEDLAFGQGWTGPDTEYRKIEKLELDDLFRAWIENELFERIVRRVIAGDISIYRAVSFAKAARVGSDLPWHQDGGRFWGLDRDGELQVWTALDDASIEAGCLEFVPGSHLAGLATPLGGVVPDVRVGAEGASSRAVAVPAAAGDIVLIHNYVWHRSGRNTTDAPRRGFTVCYIPADTRCLRKKRAPRQFVPVFRTE